VAEFGQFLLSPVALMVHLNTRILCGCILQFCKRFKRFNNEDFFNENITFATSNQSRRVFTDRWRKPGDITDIQRYNSTRQFSSKDVQDASFIGLEI
jgi:hypothetical protein